MKNYLVITSINVEAEAIKKFNEKKKWMLILVGDKKSNQDYEAVNGEYLNLVKQNELHFSLAKKAPFNHYSRKNIGYLYSIMKGAEIIGETDDDNFPYENWGEVLNFNNCITSQISKHKFVNIYDCFLNENDTVWPRGFPLEDIFPKKKYEEVETNNNIGIWQMLADVEPDVDAIYRLTINKEINFNRRRDISLAKGCYCPFNSQNTFWIKKAFSAMYLPSTVTFRFTDILRGYIAQRLIWEENLLLGFSNATVYQERNDHDLMKDFKDEIPIYQNIKSIIDIIDNTDLFGSMTENLFKLYSKLYDYEYVQKEELALLECWINDINSILNN